MADWRRIDEVFQAAVKRPAAERAAFLDEACEGDEDLRREVEELLAADRSGDSFLEAPVRAEAAALGADVSLAGRRIGPYKLIRELGRGGMGVVCLAARIDREYRQQVTIKLIQHGLDVKGIVRRFRNERQILASLNHPNIARLLDGGTTESGQPYFVMEYIQGEPIDRYCDANKLSIDDRIELFRTVCSAVHTAHQNLVVHRDLKPGNILVTADGVPKLLDFGVAKLLNPELAAQTVSPTGIDMLRLMTPAYASPEQVRGGPITTAADVYSLGVLLYELLTGHRPYRFENLTPQEIERVICDTEPVKPSTTARQAVATGEDVAEPRSARPETLGRRLEGDLDNIVLMAMRKEPRRRYGSAEQLAEDLQRHQRGLPVIARPATFGYRAGKWIRRNKPAVAIVMLLVAFAVGMFAQSIRVARERDVAKIALDRAEREATRANTVSRFLEDLFRIADPSEAEGRAVTARELLEKGARSIADELSDQPETRATLAHTMGTAYMGLGLYAEAQELFEQSLSLRRRIHGDADHPDVAESLSSMGSLSFARGEWDASAQRHRQALEMRRRLYGKEGAEIAQSLHGLAAATHNVGDHAAAEDLFRQAVEIRRRMPDVPDADLVASLLRLAHVTRNRGEVEEAEELLFEAVELEQGLEPREKANVLRDLGQQQLPKGELERAEELIRQALSIQLKILGPDHIQVAQSRNALGLALFWQGDNRAAADLFAAAHATARQVLGEDHFVVAVTQSNRAWALHRAGELDAAERLYEDALPVARRAFSGRSPGDLAEYLIKYVTLLIDRGELARAEAMTREALTLVTEVYQTGDWRIARAENALGACLSALGRHAEAEPLLVDTYPVLKREQGPRSPYALDAVERLVALYQAWGKPEQAAEYRALSPAPGAPRS